MSTMFLNEGDIAVVRRKPHNLATVQFLALVTAPRLMSEDDLLDEYAAHVGIDRSKLEIQGTYDGKAIVKLPSALVSRNELKRRIDASLQGLIGSQVTIGEINGGGDDVDGTKAIVQQVWVSEESGCVCFRFRQDQGGLPDVSFDELR